MTTSAPKAGERVADVRFDDDTMSVDLADGRTITVPWYPRLLDATPEQRLQHVVDVTDNTAPTRRAKPAGVTGARI